MGKRDTQWWTAELLGNGECDPEVLLVLEEDMPSEDTSSSGPAEPPKRLAVIAFSALTSYLVLGIVHAS